MRWQGAVRALRSGEPVMLILGLARRCGRGRLAAAAGILAATGARMMAQTSNSRIERGAGRTPITRVPYPVDQAVESLAGVRHLILVGAVAPVGFFAYPGKPGRMYPADCQVHVLARPEQDGPDALRRLADALGALPAEPPATPPRPDLPRGAVSSEAVAQALAALLPEGAVVVDESITVGPRLVSGHPRRRAARLAATDGRRHRRRHPDGDGGGCGRAGPPGGDAASGRVGDVHLAGPVDPGAGAAGRDDRDPVQPQVCDPAGGVSRRRRQPGAGWRWT